MSHPCHNWVLQFRPSHKRMQGSVLWQLYTAAAIIIFLKSARVLLSRVSDSWSPLFSYKGPIDPPPSPRYNNTLFYSYVTVYNWHSKHQREGMGTTEQWMDPHFMNNLMIMLRVQVLPFSAAVFSSDLHLTSPGTISPLLQAFITKNFMAPCLNSPAKVGKMLIRAHPLV